jgi:hypothetical protein
MTVYRTSMISLGTRLVVVAHTAATGTVINLALMFPLMRLMYFAQSKKAKKGKVESKIY